jgi:FMN-dependent NADH-azoreductase
MKHLLYIQSSPRGDSVSNKLADQLVNKLKSNHAELQVTTRNLYEGLPFVSSDMIGAFYTPADARSTEQNNLIAISEKMVDELEQTDGLIIAVPMWNFTMPAVLKAWFDLVVRVGRTFKFKPEGGFDSLLKNRKTYLIIATGGVPIGAPVDFLTPTVKTILGFMGINDIEIIAAEGTNMPNAAEKIAIAEAAIQKLAA